jgi:4-hydroxy-3-polyprenylbenzoate decarboxylase
MGMQYSNLADYIALLESRNLLKRISEQVTSELEITEITNRVMDNSGPVLLFENVDNQSIPVLTNLFGSDEKMALALGVEDIEQISQRISELLASVQSPPNSFIDKLKTLGKVLNIGKLSPKTVKNAPCQEIVLSGENVNLFNFPILKNWPQDGGRFITLPLVITKDPSKSTQNYGIYRMQVHDKNTTGIHWQTHKGAAEHYRNTTDKLEVAVAIGADPATIWAGSAPLPPNIDEMLLAGFIRNKPVDLVQCKSVNLKVPANSEIILEGYVNKGEERLEGPFGDHTGYYSFKELYPVFHVTTITHRKNPIYPSALVGRPPKEDFWMGKVTERIFLPMIKMIFPEIMDINMPAEGIFHNLLIVSIKKQYPGQAFKVMNGIWGLGLLSLTKTIIVVDDFVNIQDHSEVTWRVAGNINFDTDILISKGPLDDLDYSSQSSKFGSKLGVDATRKITGEGYTKSWPDDVIMSDDIVNLVTKKWALYNIGEFEK